MGASGTLNLEPRTARDGVGVARKKGDAGRKIGERRVKKWTIFRLHRKFVRF